MTNIDKSFRWVSKLYFSTLFARLFLALSIGIIIAEFTAIPTNIFLASLVVGLSLAIFSTLRINKFGEWIFIFSWSLFLSSSGGWLLRQTQLPELNSASTQNHSYIVEIQTPPILKNNYYQAEAEITHTTDSSVYHLIGQKIILNISSDSIPHTPLLCDTYLINTRISRPSDYGLDGFNYGKYLIRNGLCGVSYINTNNYKYLKSSSPSNLIAHTYNLRDKLIQRFKISRLENSQLAIISAITLGEKNLLSNEQKDSFSAAGVSHILVVSGMHVGFIFAIILLLFKKVSPKRRWIITSVGLLFLWFYALLTGLAPSVIRATFMFSMILIFRVLGEKYRVEHALSFSATILLLFNPNTLFDIGFQLSYLAVIGIIYLYPKLHKLIIPIKSKIVRWTLQSVALTLSAQLFTLPIVIYNFNQFPIYFFISNIFVTIFAPIIFLAGILLLPLSFIPHLNLFLGQCINFIINLFEQIITFITSIPYATTNVYLSLLECILFYIVILCIINWIELRNLFSLRFKTPLYLFFALLFFITSISISNLYYSQKNVLIIPETNYLIVNIFNRDTNLLFTNQPDLALKKLERTHLKYTAPQPTIICDTTLTNNSFYFNGEHYLILRDNIFRYLQNNNSPLDIDCLIIDRGVYPSERLFTEFTHPKHVIITSSVWNGYIEKYKTLLDSINIPYHIISEDGAIYFSY